LTAWQAPIGSPTGRDCQNVSRRGLRELNLAGKWRRPLSGGHVLAGQPVLDQLAREKGQ